MNFFIAYKRSRYFKIADRTMVSFKFLSPIREAIQVRMDLGSCKMRDCRWLLTVVVYRYLCASVVRVDACVVYVVPSNSLLYAADYARSRCNSLFSLLLCTVVDTVTAIVQRFGRLCLKTLCKFYASNVSRTTLWFEKVLLTYNENIIYWNIWNNVLSFDYGRSFAVARIRYLTRANEVEKSYLTRRVISRAMDFQRPIWRRPISISLSLSISRWSEVRVRTVQLYITRN